MIHNPDILERLRHAQPLAKGPYRRLINDSITEIERLRSLITEWYEAECAELRHFPPGLEAMTRASKAREALFKETNQ